MHAKKSHFHFVICTLLLALLLPASSAWAKAPGSMGAVQIKDNQFPAMDLDGDGKNDTVTLLTQQSDANGQENIISFGFSQRGHMAFSIGYGTQLSIQWIDAADVTGDQQRSVILAVKWAEAAKTRDEFFVLRITRAEVDALPLPLFVGEQLGYQFSVKFDTRHTLQIEGASSNFYLLAPLDPKKYTTLYSPEGYVADTACLVAPATSFTVVPYGANSCGLQIHQTVTSIAVPGPIGELLSTLIWRSGQYQLVSQEFVVAP